MARKGPGRSKMDDALDVLRQLGFPKQQQNERSALTLLVLLVSVSLFEVVWVRGAGHDH